MDATSIPNTRVPIVGASSSVLACVSNYVRSKILNDNARAECLQKLKANEPYTEAGFGAIVMIDVSGYSTAFSHMQSTLGKIASEVITNTVGRYMDLIIRRIAEYEGDVIKFLGDAVIVCFPQKSGEPESSCIERAAKCCLQILVKYSIISIDLESSLTHFASTGQAMEDNRRLSVTNDNVYGTSTSISKQKTLTSPPPTTSLFKDPSRHMQLTIHVGMAASSIEHVIFGAVDTRLDYVVHGPGLQTLGDVLDGASGGELGIHADVLKLSEKVRNAVSLKSVVNEDGYAIIRKDVLRSVLNTLENYTGKDAARSSMKGSNESDDDEAEYVPPPNIIPEEDTEDIMELMKRDCLSKNVNISQKSIELLECFVNQSLLKKLKASDDTMRRSSANPSRRLSIAQRQNDGIAAEFRNVSIVFIKIKSTFDAVLAQTLFSKFAEILKSFEGTFQQYSVDDKGDVVNLAARLLGISSTASNIRCDKATYVAAKEDFHFVNLGPHKVKGKVEEVGVWAVKPRESLVATKNNDTSVTGKIVGYIKERSMLAEAIQSWSSTSTQTKVVIQGKSGIGKSRLIQFASSELSATNIPFCLAQGTEIKQSTPYFGLSQLVYFIFRRHADFSELTSSTGNDRRRSSFAGPSSSILGSVAASLGSRVSTGSSIHSGLGSKRQSRPSVGKFPTISNETTEMGEQLRAVQKFLKGMGENPLMAPILTPVLPFTIADNALTKNMDAQTRSALLKSILTRIVVETLNRSKFSMIFDDSQWIDSASFEVISSIIKSGAGALIIFFTRPMDELKTDFLPKVIAMPTTISMHLMGFSEADTDEFLRNKFDGIKPFKSIDQKVVEVLKESSEGLPLILDTITDALKDQFDAVFKVEDERLCFATSQSQMLINRVSSVGNATLLQFDKLHPALQDILRKASILGQYFNLCDLAYFLEDAMSPEEIESVISSHDTFNYLLKQSSDSDNTPFAYYFRHIQIMNAIYSSQSYADRNRIHETVLEFFEQALTAVENPESLLSSVVHHVMKTTQTEKQIKYLEQLGVSNARNAHFTEAVGILEQLLQVAEAHPGLVESKLRLAQWMVYYARSRLETKDYSVKPICLQAFHNLGRPWPADPKSTKKALVRTALRIYKLWRITKGGTQPVRNFWERLKGSTKVTPLSEDAKTSADTTQQCLRVMIMVSLYGGLLSKEETVLVLLSLVEVLIVQGFERKVEWAGMCYIVGFHACYAAPLFSNPFFNNGIKIEQALEDKTPMHAYGHVCGPKYLSMGMLNEVDRHGGQYASYATQRGDYTQVLLGLSLQQSAYHLQGRIHHRESDFLEALKEESTFHTPICTGLLRASLLTNDHDKSLKMFKITQDSYNTLPKRTIFEPFVTVPQALFAFKKGDFDTALERFHYTSTRFDKSMQFNPSTLDHMHFLVVFSVMMIDPFVPNTPQKTIHTWSPTQLSKLKETFLGLQKAAHSLVKKKMALTLWPYIFFTTIHLVLCSKRTQAFSFLLKHARRERESMRVLKEMRFHRANVCAFLGVYYEKQKEREEFFREAVSLFEEFGAGYVKDWLEQINVVLRPTLK
ncbi:hypothetical protein HDV05_002918 [Chytridiales sp. JEL 0842]|nr:hypothetical protein HDV05_002918 [Chytridiales sp. JEL 0842]